jgi:hypothetical protein
MVEQEQAVTVGVDAVVSELLAEADAPKDTTGQPGRFRPVTWCCLAAVVVMLALGVMGGAAAVLWFIQAGIIGLGLLVAGIRDLTTPSPRGRDTARQAARCHVKWLRYGDWKRAHSCVKPETLPETESLPRIDKLRIVPEQATRRTVYGFKRYWKAIIGSKDGMVRQLRGAKLSPLSAREGDCVRTTATLTVEVYSSMVYAWLLLGAIPAVIAYLVVRKRVRVEIELLLYRHRSQWWVVPGTPRGPDEGPSLPEARIRS